MRTWLTARNTPAPHQLPCQICSILVKPSEHKYQDALASRSLRSPKVIGTDMDPLGTACDLVNRSIIMRLSIVREQGSRTKLAPFRHHHQHFSVTNSNVPSCDNCRLLSCCHVTPNVLPCHLLEAKQSFPPCKEEEILQKVPSRS